MIVGDGELDRGLRGPLRLGRKRNAKSIGKMEGRFEPSAMQPQIGSGDFLI
jgi:hypothetical protein